MLSVTALRREEELPVDWQGAQKQKKGGKLQRRAEAEGSRTSCFAAGDAPPLRARVYAKASAE